MRFTLFKALILFMLPAYAAWGAEALTPINFKGQYDFAFSGLRFGKMGIEADQTADRYAVTSDIMSTGLIGAFVRHTSHTTVTGSGANFTYPAMEYESNYQTKKKKKYVKMLRSNWLIEETLVPPDSRATRPAVEAELKKTAFDPLTMLLAMRKGVWDAMHGGAKNFTLNAYDGRRLTEANFTVRDKGTMDYKGEPVAVILVDVRRKQLAGFTEKEIADYNPKEPTLHMYVTDDERLIPLRLEATVWMGTLSATLTNQCGTAGSCLLGNKE
jgi:hypothetical protein